ncbi:hypothetical protein [Pseudoxanthomonas sp. 10H]|uniref:hypothetical protein n=1 Tax=Pseudoxanthomonas sp. 10H TaxID=3242729 RepID=UPI003557D689
MKSFSPHLLLLAPALVLSLVWDIGYSLLSLESVVGLVAALMAGFLLGLLSVNRPRLRAVLLVFLFLSLLDVFFLRAAWMAWLVLAAGLSIAARFHERVPATALVASGVAFSLILLLQAPQAPAREVALADLTGAGETSMVVHLLFDELGALDVIPAEYRRHQDVAEIAGGYASRGFTVYEDVLSVSPDTHRAMSALLDSTYINSPDGNVKRFQGEDRYRVVNNEVHRRMEDENWPVTIIQSWYLDYCRPEFSCITYSLAGSASVFERLPDRKRRLQIFRRELIAALVSNDRGLVLVDLARFAIHERLTVRSSWRNPALPLVAMQQLDQLQEGLVSGSGRHYVFAHVLLPHFPWVLDGNCQIKESSGWRLPYAARTGSSEAKAEAYAAYQDQSLCMHRKVLALIDAVDSAHPGQVQFVIHGDHGPRILRRTIPNKGVDSLDEQTRKNLLSPFVAARLAGGGPASVRSTGAPLQKLIPDLLSRATQRRQGVVSGSWGGGAREASKVKVRQMP